MLIELVLADRVKLGATTWTLTVAVRIGPVVSLIAVIPIEQLPGAAFAATVTLRVEVAVPFFGGETFVGLKVVVIPFGGLASRLTVPL